MRSPKRSLQSGGMVKKFFCSLNAKSSTTIGSSESALNNIVNKKYLHANKIKAFGAFHIESKMPNKLGET